MRFFPLFAAVSVFLGTFSPALVRLGGDFSDPASRHGLFYVWFYWLPTRVDWLLMPNSDALTLGLAIAVYVAQYATLLAVVAAVAHTGRILLDFLKPHKHRAGLIQVVSK
jgi:hypothetical protein